LLISELMPKAASIADKIAFIRSLFGSAGAHDLLNRFCRGVDVWGILDPGISAGERSAKLPGPPANCHPCRFPDKSAWSN
jgi:hypothetical protein